MYYSETKQSPITEKRIQSEYGFDPVADPQSALACKLYPVVLFDNDDYQISHYRKEGDTYVQVPHCVTQEEFALVQVTRKLNLSLENFRTSRGLPTTPEVPVAVDGYYPLYTSEAEANLESSDNTSTTYTFNLTDYFMPNAGVKQYLGDYLN